MRFLCLLLCLLGLAGTAHADNSVTIMDGTVRMIPGTDAPAAGFVTLHNTQKKPIILEKVTSKIVDRIEIHEMQMANGVMRMRPLKNLPLPPEQEVVLESGGLHLMLFGLGRVKGSQIPMIFHFNDGTQQQYYFPVTTPPRKGEAE